MTMIEQSLYDIFEQKGIYLSETDKDDELEMDSLQFISIVIEIEYCFSISIDDDWMTDKLKTFNDFLICVEKMTPGTT